MVSGPSFGGEMVHVPDLHNRWCLPEHEFNADAATRRRPPPACGGTGRSFRDEFVIVLPDYD